MTDALLLAVGHVAAKCRGRKKTHRLCGRKSHNCVLCFKLFKRKEHPAVAITAFWEIPIGCAQHTHKQTDDANGNGENREFVLRSVLFCTASCRFFITEKLFRKIRAKIVVMLGAFRAANRQEWKYKLARLYIDVLGWKHMIFV